MHVLPEPIIMITRSRKLPHRASFYFWGTLALLVSLEPVTTQGATYYVATTGSDSNPGTSDRPWRNPKKCVSTLIQAGDTCIVRNGTYTDSTGKGLLVYASGSSPSGTASEPITIKSESPFGALMIIPSHTNAVNAAFYITRPYYVIEGFDISGGNRAGHSVSYAGIVFTRSATGGIARINSIHHIGQTVCSNSVYGFSGIFIQGTSDVLIERNQIYSIGRLRDRENGCATTLFQNDHGIYVEGATNVIVRRNVIYDTNRGWPIHVYKPGGTTTNLDIYHNTFSGHSPTGKPAGHILLSKTINGANIRNNISSDAQIGMVTVYSLTASRVVVSHNLSDTLEKTGLNIAGVTFSNNIQYVDDLGFADKSQNDFRLTAESAAINRGTAIGVPPVKDQAPDIGAYEFSEQESSLSSITDQTGQDVQQ